MTVPLRRRLTFALFVTLAVAALLRGWSFSQVGGSYMPSTDQEESYYEQGVAWLSRGVFSLGLTDARPRAWRGPAFPAFAAASELPFREPTPAHLRLAQHLLSVLGVGFAFWLGLLAAGPAGAVVGAALFALDPGQILSSNSLNVHAFYGLALLALAGAAAWWADKPMRGRGLLLGAAFGVSLLARSTHFMSVPIVLALGAWRGDGVAKAARRAAWPALGLLLALAPWTARNALQFHRFQPLDSNSGAVNFYAASRGEVGSWSIPAAVQAAEPESPGLVEAYARDRDLVFPVLLRLATRRVLASPLAYARGCLRRMLVLYGPLWPAVLAAAAALFFLRRSRAALAAGGVLFSLGAYALVAVQPGYAEAARPLLAVLAGWGLAAAFAAATRRRTPAFKRADAPRAATALAAAFACGFVVDLATADALILREPSALRAATNDAGDGRAASLLVLFARREPRSSGEMDRGVIMVDTGRSEEACLAFAAAWRADPRRLEAGARSADCLAVEGKGVEAEALARTVLARARPRDGLVVSRAHAALAKALTARKKIDEAVREWQLSADAAGGALELRRGAGEGLLSLGRAKEAAVLADRSVADAAQSTPSERAAAYFLRGNVRLALGRRDDAAADFRAAASSASGAQNKRAAAEGLLSAGRAREALPLAEEAVASDGASPAAQRAADLVARARAYLGVGRGREALDDLRRAALPGPDGLPAIAAAAKAAETATDPALARGLVDLLLVCAGRTPGDRASAAAWDAVLSRVKGLRGAKRDADALSLLSAALGGPLARATPDTRAGALIVRAALQWSAGRATAGASDLAAALDADAATACRNAPTAVDPGSLPADYFSACLSRFPHDAVLLSDQGVALWRDGHPAEALASLRAALDADPGNIAAALSLNAALGPAGGDEGRRHLEAALARSTEPKASPLRAQARAALGGR
jgi:tetratricopeptide (TPR) repeat protein